MSLEIYQQAEENNGSKRDLNDFLLSTLLEEVNEPIQSSEINARPNKLVIIQDQERTVFSKWILWCRIGGDHSFIWWFPYIGSRRGTKQFSSIEREERIIYPSVLRSVLPFPPEFLPPSKPFPLNYPPRQFERHNSQVCHFQCQLQVISHQGQQLNHRRKTLCWELEMIVYRGRRPWMLVLDHGEHLATVQAYSL